MKFRGFYGRETPVRPDKCLIKLNRPYYNNELELFIYEVFIFLKVI